MSARLSFPLSALLVLAALNAAHAADPITLINVKDPGPNKKDEPILKQFSLEKAVHFLDSASLTWQKKRGCFTCHTNLAYLYARPQVSSDVPAHRSVRQFAEQLVKVRWPKKGPRWDAEVVATAAALAFNDAATTGKLHPVTKTALDKMWPLQNEQGGWDWLKCDWPPMESDDHYGVTLAALAVGVAPGDYAKTPKAKKGMSDIRRYFSNNPPPTLHHEAMLLWANAHGTNVLSDKEQKSITEKLLAIQNKDGGWNLPSLGNWEREDKKPQDTKTSDGYATGFVIFVLREAGVPAKNHRIQKGIAWLKRNQRASGRWYTRSPYMDSRHYISHAGSAFAVMALAKCGELKAKK